MAYKLSGGAGGDINTERKGRGGRRKVRPRPRPQPRPAPTVRSVGNAATRGAIRVSPQPARTRAVVRSRAQARTRVNRVGTSYQGDRVGMGARKVAPKPLKPRSTSIRKGGGARLQANRTKVGAQKVAALGTGKVARIEERRAAARKAVIAQIFRGKPGTLNTGKFPYVSPDVESLAKYRAYGERLWPKVRKDFGLPDDAKMPPLFLKSDAEMKARFPKITNSRSGLIATAHKNIHIAGNPAGKVKRGTPGYVKVSPGITFGSSSKWNNPRKGRKGARHLRDFSHSVLLHEWAHLNQDLSVPKWLKEGAAEGFSVARARKHHLRVPPRSKNNEYSKWLRRVRREKGEAYITHGQFGRVAPANRRARGAIGQVGKGARKAGR